MDFDIEDELSRIDVPTLVLAGRYDEIIPLESQKELHGKIKNSRLIVFDDVRHNLLVGKNNEKILDILKKEV
jgi:pimeloyl-ACP methyl ester carboxylesterase